MSGVAKIEITESVETLKKLLINASKPQEKERIQTIYWLKTKTVKTVKEISIMLGRNRVTVQKWLRKYRTGGLPLLLESKKNKGGRPRSIPASASEKLKEELKNTEGFQSYSEIQLWLRTCFDREILSFMNLVI